MHEINSVFGVYGISVDMRHLGLIADFMTHEGGYKAINRHGMFSEPSPLLKMTFETTMGFLTDAAVAGDVDRLSTPAASIVTGRHAALRTRLARHARTFRADACAYRAAAGNPCSAAASFSAKHPNRLLTRGIRCASQAAALRYRCVRALRTPPPARRRGCQLSTALAS